MEQFKSGFAAFIGRPNAGKSTMLNQLIGEKIAIVSDKPQTTRTRIQGVLTLPQGQIIFVDTPGVHKPGYRLNRRMMQAVIDAIESVDVLLLIVDATTGFGHGDRFVLDLIKQASTPSFLLLNKIDLIKDKSELLPLIDFYQKEHDFKEIIPVSALVGDGKEVLLNKLLEYLPEGPMYFSEDDLTDQPERVIVAEIVREKILELTEEEIPYATAVVTERFTEEENLIRIYCNILVEKQSQKPIIIGRGGQRLKLVGTRARQEIERLLGKKVYLELYVKVKEHWRNDERVLDEIGIVGGRQ